MQQESFRNSQDEIQISLGDKLWKFTRFAVVTGMIFGISIFVMNFQAYAAILASVLNPGAQQEKNDVLVGAAGGMVDESLLLPVLNSENEDSYSYAWLDFPVVPTDYRLVVPKIGKSVPIKEMDPAHLNGKNWPELERQFQETLRNGVAHYPTTANPGQYGNVFITGHSSYYPWDPGKYKEVFSLLDQLEVGDEYYVYYEQKKYTYKIFEKLIVSPEDTSYLAQPKDKMISTLMTCYPAGFTTSRLMVRAELQV